MRPTAGRPSPAALGMVAAAALAALALLAPPVAPEVAAAGPAGKPAAAVTGVLPVAAPAPGASLRLRLAPGELPRGAAVIVEAGGRKISATSRVLARYPDGSAALLEVVAVRPPAAAGRLLTIRGLHLADPVGLDPERVRAGEPPVSATAPTDLAGLIEETVWQGEVKREGSSPPPWWSTVDARMSSEVDPSPAARLDFVEVAYAEKGRPREAVRLDAMVLDQIGEPKSPEARHNWLRGAYEIAHLYEGVLQDPDRALAWYLRCAGTALADPSEARQNTIAAGFGAARAVEGLGERGAALALYRLLARDLIVSPDPYGDLILPEVYLRIGDAERAAGDTGAATAAYRATESAAGRLPASAPSSFRAPGSAARAALRLLGARGLDFGRIADGTYTGQAFGYNAPVGVRMTFRGGKCTALHVTDLGDKRPLDSYRLVPERILDRQGLEVDAVTGATVTSRAVVSAATEAAFQGVRDSAAAKEPKTGSSGPSTGGARPAAIPGGRGGH